MKLYGRGQSRSFRGLWALYESGLTFEYEEVAEVTPAYIALNSQGKVPTLIAGDIVLTESAAIVGHVLRTAGGAHLPDAPADIARYDEIAFFVLSDLEQSLWTIGKHRFALPEAQRVEAVLATAVFEFGKAQQALHEHMATRRYAVGEAFSGADILLAHTINWAIRFEMAVDQAFVDYRDRLYQRPACQQALAAVAG